MGDGFWHSDSTRSRSATGRALLLGRRRRRAGMLRIAVARRRTTCHPASSPASATNVGRMLSSTNVGFRQAAGSRDVSLCAPCGSTTMNVSVLVLFAALAVLTLEPAKNRVDVLELRSRSDDGRVSSSAIHVDISEEDAASVSKSRASSAPHEADLQKSTSRMEIIELQDRIASRVAQLPKTRWDEIRFHYENAVLEGTRYEIFTANSYLNGERRDFTLPLETLDLLVELQAIKPSGQAETWLWLEFTMHSSGKYRFDYQYSTPPQAAQQAQFVGGRTE